MVSENSHMRKVRGEWGGHLVEKHGFKPIEQLLVVMVFFMLTSLLGQFSNNKMQFLITS